MRLAGVVFLRRIPLPYLSATAVRVLGTQCSWSQTCLPIMTAETLRKSGRT